MNQNPLTIFDVLQALYSRKHLLSGIFLAIVGAGMVVTLLLPPTYGSTMKILVTRERIDPQVTPAEKSSDRMRGELSEEEFNSELEILQSRAVIEGVARQLGLDKQYAEAPRGWFGRLRASLANLYRSLHKQVAPKPMERAVASLTENLEVVSVKKSRIIKVSYTDSNPERAAQVLAELYRQFTEHHLRLLQSSKAANVFREQSEAFSKKLNEATEMLKRFDGQNGVAANSSQRDLLLQQYYQVQGELDKTRTEIREIERRVPALKTQLAAQPERIESETRTMYVSARDKIKDEILTLDLQRTQLLQKYQPNHRLVKEVEERLAQARELLAREEKSPPQERTTVLNDVHRRLASELLTAESNLTALHEREETLAALADQYKAQTVKSDVKSLERAGLERIRAINEEAYLLYNKKAQEAEIVNALDQKQIVNFSLAEAPAVSHKPVSPKLLINLAVLVVVGLTAAIAIVLALERKRLMADRLRQIEAIRNDSMALADGKSGLTPQTASLLLSGAQSWLNGHQSLAVREQDPPASEESPEVAAEAERKPLSSQNELIGRNGHHGQTSLVVKKPESWRVEAVVDYLYHVYYLSPEKLSEVLRHTASWEVSPSEIIDILLRVSKHRPPVDQMRQGEESAAKLK